MSHNVSLQDLTPFHIFPGHLTLMLSGSKKQSDEERGVALFAVRWSYLLALLNIETQLTLIRSSPITKLPSIVRPLLTI